MRLVAVLMSLGLAVLGLTVGVTPAEASACKSGYVWVKSKPQTTARGQNIVGADVVVQKGRCVRKPGAADGQAARTNQREDSQRSLTDCLLKGISGSEIDGGYLTIQASRSVSCPDPLGMAQSRTIDVTALARSLIVRLRLPDANPRFGPNPNGNEWHMLAVGFPVWLWTDGPRHKEATASAYGISFRLSADLASTTFNTGDGGQVTCSSMATYSEAVKAGSPSPNCGHVYTKPSLPKGPYTVTATPTWRIRWSAGGFSGTLTTSYSDSSTIRIGELRALNR